MARYCRVNNDAVALKIVNDHLTRLGYRTVCKQTAEEASELVRTDPPAVIVLELLLHGMNGFRFLEELRRTPIGRLIPVIVWTVKALSLDERRRLRDSAQAIMPRGDTSDLLERLTPYLTNAQRSPDSPGGAS